MMKQNYRKTIDFHADDFGVSKHSCDDIFCLIKKHYIDSLSILPNMSSFSYATDLLNSLERKDIDNLNITVHLNFMEGHCCSSLEQIPALVDKKGLFKISWGKLFIYNYLPFIRNKIKKQLTLEIISQTQKVIDSGILQGKELRFDGHQHTHMIPVVFEALLNAVKYFEQKDFKTEYIRNTQDPLKPYFKEKTIKKSYNKINLIKCLILNFYSIKIRKALIKIQLPVNYLCGVFFSGFMDYERLIKVLLQYQQLAQMHSQKIELLFHPGTVLAEEITEEFVKPGFNIFHLSEGRKIEYTAIEKFNENQ